MKNLGKFFAMAAFGFFAVSCNNTGEAIEANDAQEVSTPEETSATYVVSTEGDEINWVGFKTITGDQHNGTIQVSEGKLDTHNGEIVGGSFVVDMNSIFNEDLPAEGDYNKEKLVGHLKSADFFDVENHPTATFTITGITAVENGENGVTHNISGNLKMRGTEKNITFPAAVSMTDDMIMISAPEFTIDRTNWNVMYGSKNIESVAKDQAIDNNIKLVIDLKAAKQA
jgi:polyisoprenoid-binding protein YceI